ncbi:MAG: penicillin-binding protein 2 [Pseudomonadota bacterium]
MISPIQSADSRHDIRQQSLHVVRKRVAWMCGFALVASMVLAWRAYDLQIVRHSHFVARADTNRILIEPIVPNRGLIYAENGEALAGNVSSFTLSLVSEQLKNLDESIQLIHSWIPLQDIEIANFKRRLKQKRRPYEAIPLKFQLSENEIAHLAINQHRLPGMSLSADLLRTYPFAEMTSHITGYIAQIDEVELKKYPTSNYLGTNYVGKTGIEVAYEELLHGTVGLQKNETNARGRLLRVLEEVPAKPGADLHLFLDMVAQKAAANALADKRGAIVAIDPRNGGILAAFSSPTFDPNMFAKGVQRADYLALANHPDKPLFNRIVLGQYPPGSTIKPMMALAAVHAGATNWKRIIYDPGFYKLDFDPRPYRDWKREGHGSMNLHGGIMNSCDTVFYDIAHRMGIDKMNSYITQFGLGSKTGVEWVGEKPGVAPSSKWKKERIGAPWYPGETLIAGIGQGYMLATPLQLAVMTATIASKGQLRIPRLLKSIHYSDGRTQVADTNPIHTLDWVDEENWEKVFAAMTDVIHSPRGTAHRIAAGLTFQMAGKTGTAQVIALPEDGKYDAAKLEEYQRDHALFVGFAPVDNPTIAVSVLVENGGSGSGTAAPLARQVLEAYLTQHVASF